MDWCEVIGKQSSMRGVWVWVEEKKELAWTNIQRARVRVFMHSIELMGHWQAVVHKGLDTYLSMKLIIRV